MLKLTEIEAWVQNLLGRRNTQCCCLGFVASGKPSLEEAVAEGWAHISVPIRGLLGIPCRCHLESRPLLHNARGLLADPVPLLLRSCAHGACAGLGSCTKPPIAHTASMNCTSDGPRHMECSITCEKGFVLRSSSGKSLGSTQVSDCWAG